MSEALTKLETREVHVPIRPVLWRYVAALTHPWFNTQLNSWRWENDCTVLPHSPITIGYAVPRSQAMEPRLEETKSCLSLGHGWCLGNMKWICVAPLISFAKGTSLHAQASLAPHHNTDISTRGVTLHKQVMNVIKEASRGWCALRVGTWSRWVKRCMGSHNAYSLHDDSDTCHPEGGLQAQFRKMLTYFQTCINLKCKIFNVWFKYIMQYI